MSGNTGTVKITLQMTDKGAVKVLKTTGSESEKTGKKGKDAFDKMDKSARSFTKSANAGAKSIISMKTAVVGLISVGGVVYLKSLSASFTEAASEAKNLEVALDTLTKGKGVETFEALNYWAMKMPVNTQEAILTFQKLRAFGLEPTLEDMTTLVDATSALGGDKGTLPGIARALGQMSTNQRVLREELNQLAERGIPAVQILKEELGLTADQLQDIGNAGLDVNVVLDALMTGMEKRFGGASSKMMTEWSGMIESSKSLWWEFRRAVMESGPFDAMKEGLKEFLDYLSTNEGQMDLKTWAQNTAVATLTAFGWMIEGAKLFSNSIAGIRKNFGSMMKIISNRAVTDLEKAIKSYDKFYKEQNDSGTVTVNFKKQQQYAASIKVLKDKLDNAKISLSAANMMIKDNTQVISDNDKAYNALISKIDEWKSKTKDIKLFGGAKDIEGAGIGNGESDPVPDTTSAKEQAKLDALLASFEDDYKRAMLSSYDYEIYILNKRYRDHDKLVKDKAKLDDWYTARYMDIIEREAAETDARVQEELNNILDQLDQVEDKGVTFTQTIQDAIVGWSNSFSSALNDMMWEADASFGDIAESFGKMLTEMIIQKYAAEPLMEFASWGIGSITSDLFHSESITSDLFHSGGVVGSGEGDSVSVSSSVFADAPRFHSGLMPNEFPAILEEGEGVFTKNQMAALGGAINSGSNTEINIFDQRTADSPAVDVNTTQGPDGRQQINITIKKAVQAMMSDGSMDKTMRSNYGVSRAVVRR